MKDSHHLNSEMKFKVTSTKIICYLSGKFQIRRALNIEDVKTSSI